MTEPRPRVGPSYFGSFRENLCGAFCGPSLGWGVGLQVDPRLQGAGFSWWDVGVLECFLENMNRGFCAEIWVSVWMGEGPMGG